MSNGSIWPIDRTLSGAATPGQSGPGSDDKRGVPRILQISCGNGTSPPDSLVIFLLGGGLSSLQRCSRYIQQP